jgi:hypothetical protein
MRAGPSPIITVPETFLSEEHYSQALRRAERDWLTQFTSRLQGGTLQRPGRDRKAARVPDRP